MLLLFSLTLIPITQSDTIEHKTTKSNNTTPNILNPLIWRPREVQIIVNEKIKNRENFTLNASIYLPIPMNLSSQTIHYPINYNIQPDEYKIDSWGQKVAIYSRTLKPEEKLTINWKINATVYTIRHLLFPWQVQGEIPSEIKEKYTADAINYQIHNPLIQNIVKEQTAKIKNPLIKSILLCQYVGDHLTYVLDDRWDDAPTVLTRGNGSCSEYCFVYIALLRAAGIPARYMGGTVQKTNEYPYIDKVFHRIAEIYLPNYGWIPIDPTWTDSVKIPFLYFGSYQNNLLIFNIGGGPSEFLDWNYCHWEEFTPDSKNVTIDLSFTWKKL